MRIPRLSGRELIKLLYKFGCVPVRHRGSHVILVRYVDGEKVGTAVPLHEELKIGTLRGILRQLKIAPEDFLELFRR